MSHPTFVACQGCLHYLGQSPDEDFCAHPDFHKPDFLNRPIEQCKERPRQKLGLMPNDKKVK